MRRTSLLKKYERILVEVNDQLCYYLFSDHELGKLVTGFEDSISHTYTTEQFPDNPYSTRIHIPIEGIPLFRQKALNSLLASNLLACIEYLLEYISEVQSFREKVVVLGTQNTPTDKAPEDKLNTNIKKWSSNTLDSSFVKTLQYLRLRRNHIAHVNDSLSAELNSLIKNSSNLLNQYWESKGVNLFGFNFSSAKVSEIYIEEAFALTNIIRVCLRQIDSNIIETISEESIQKYEAKRFFHESKTKHLKLSTGLRKFNAQLIQKYAQETPCSEESFLQLRNSGK